MVIFHGYVNVYQRVSDVEVLKMVVYKADSKSFSHDYKACVIGVTATN